MNLNSDLFERLQARAGACDVRDGCELRILHDSSENFSAWLVALAAAERFILIEMYIFADDTFGRKIRDLLVEKARAGVQVYLVYDWVGSIVPAMKNFFRPLHMAGAQVVAYNPFGFARGIGLISRNHRKSIIVDGHTAFVSGLCLSSAWEGNPAKKIAPWRDTGVMLRGEAAIADLIAAFADTLSAQGKTLPDNIRAQAGSSQAHARIGIVATTPNDNNMLRVDLNAIALAERRLWLTDAYFMPTRLYTQALINAAAAGVDVRILVPQTSDIAWIARVSRTRYRELLQAGVRVFEWNGTMIHAKSAVADGRWARIGSTNLNFASWHFNRELDVVLEDTDLAEQLEVQFLRDLDNATEIVLNDAENAVAVERRKQGLLRLKIRSRTQAQAVARQLLRFGHAFEGNFYGAKIVDEREAYAYLSLGAMLLGAGLLLWFFPKLLVMPVMLLLVVGGASTVWSAWRQIRRFHGKK